MTEEEKKVDGQTAEPAAQKKKKKWPIVVGVVVAVLVVAGAGFWVWHEQPSFCNAICHTPMDAYLPTYEAEPGQAATDVWGNEVANASGMMAAVHRAEKRHHLPRLPCSHPVRADRRGHELDHRQLRGSEHPDRPAGRAREVPGGSRGRPRHRARSVLPERVLPQHDARRPDPGHLRSGAQPARGPSTARTSAATATRRIALP